MDKSTLPAPSVKLCPKCGITKPIEDFAVERSKKGGRASWCRPCKYAANTRYHLADPERYRALRRNHYSRQKDVRRARDKARYAANPEKARERKFRRLYGITREQFATILRGQGGRCAICGTTSEGRPWHIDHDHETGCVRGVLCLHCNALLGYTRDDVTRLQAAVAYLSGPPGPRLLEARTEM